MKETDLYLLNQSHVHQEILFYLIDVIEKEVENIELLYKYKIPFFYYKKKSFCYLTVNKKLNYVDLGFVKGYQHKKNLEYLIGEKRNTIKSLRYFKLDSVPHKILKEVIQEAKSFY